MDAYVYQAALWCEDCAKPIMAKLGQDPEFGSDHYPQGPYSDGGGEADTPQHCDACGCFLENPLTADGYRYVKEALIEHARDGSGNAEVLKQWAEHYHAPLFEPGQADLDDLEFEYSLEDDDWRSAMSWWFAIAGELYVRGAPIPEEWQYHPGVQPVNPDDRRAFVVAAATTETLMRFMEDVEDDLKRLKREGKDY